MDVMCRRIMCAVTLATTQRKINTEIMSCMSENVLSITNDLKGYFTLVTVTMRLSLSMQVEYLRLSMKLIVLAIDLTEVHLDAG